MFLSKRTQGIFDRFMPVTNATDFTNYDLSLALYHCNALGALGACIFIAAYNLVGPALSIY